MSVAQALMGIVFRNGLGVGRVESGALVEVVGEDFPGGLVVFATVELHVEFGLRWAPGGMGERGRSGLTDMGQDLRDGLRIGQERDEGEGRLAGWADEGEDFIDPGQEGGPSQDAGRSGLDGPHAAADSGLGRPAPPPWFPAAAQPPGPPHGPSTHGGSLRPDSPEVSGPDHRSGRSLQDHLQRDPGRYLG